MTTLARLTFEQEDEIRESGKSPCILATSINNKYQVTTCYRQSSAMLAPNQWYYETFVWKWLGKGERDLIGDETGRDHFEVVRHVMREGYPIKWEDEE